MSSQATTFQELKTWAALPASSEAKEETTVLYCVSYNHLNRREWLAANDIPGKQKAWKLKFEYLHAVDAQHARFLFIMGRPNKNMNGYDIVGIAPVVGYSVNDNHGEKLSV
jgi:hypothetical protein